MDALPGLPGPPGGLGAISGSRRRAIAFITSTQHYKLVGGWLAGGTSVANLTDPARGRELASWTGEAWASYWYNGRVYSSGAAGLRVFKFAYPGARRFDVLNPQTQMTIID